MATVRELVPTTTLTSDASGGWGCGAYWEYKWFQLAWDETANVSSNIVVKDVTPVVTAAAMWGTLWKAS